MLFQVQSSQHLSIAVKERHKNLNKKTEHLSILDLTEANQNPNFFFLFVGNIYVFFLTDIDSALPHEICCGRGNNLQLGFSFYSVISSRNHFVLTVTNAPELFGRPERVSYIYFISLFLTKEFIFFVPDSFRKCVSVLKIRRTTRVHVEIVCRCCRPREALSNQSTGHQQGQNLRLFSPPIIKCSLLAISALFPLLL